MNRLPLLHVLLPLALAACGTATTPATSSDDAGGDTAGTDAVSDVAGTDAAADAAADAVDAAADVSAVAPATACKSDCDKQKADCATILLADCYGICDYVAPGLKGADCIAKQTAAWECEATVAWVCDPAQTAVGALKDPNSCKAEHDARDAACPK